ncbi:hypothetical protein PR048_006435 [Dryococelus australis]|uniref:Uncharacterized protein n=1 Tax=Dryococelus australis TaxID=614101 RepID=A0ABQ9IAZ0_9NEOP|nr:hypothetical protein PR048_006435 [Dryococelus australis]
MDISAERDSPCISVKKLNSGTRKRKRYGRTSDVMKLRPRNPEESASFHDNAYSYRMRVKNEDGNKDTVVSYNAFISLHGITRKRMRNIYRSL